MSSVNSFLNMSHLPRLPRPNWIRQHDFIPCNCNKCFFCLKGLTTGISHKRKVKTVFVEKNNKRRVVIGHIDERVKLQSCSSYCRMCYRNNKGAVDSNGKKLNAEERKKLCNWSYMGCTECCEPICDVCWDKGYDKHRSK